MCNRKYSDVMCDAYHVENVEVIGKQSINRNEVAKMKPVHREQILGCTFLINALHHFISHSLRNESSPHMHATHTFY